MAQYCYWNDWCNDDWWWIWILIFFFFIFFLLLVLPWSYYRRSDYCGEYLPAERYNYRPSRVVEIQTEDDDLL